MDTNFPVHDAVIQPDTLLQFTISPEQHKGELEKLPEIRAQLRASPEDHRIIFIIPEKNIKSFRYHPLLANVENWPDIGQLICVADPSVVGEKTLMNE